jgi:uncharacterized protein (DUF2141 family)
MPCHARRRLVRRVLATLCLLSAAAVSPDSQAASDTITVPLAGLKSDQGQVACTLFGSADGFPTQPQKAVARQFQKISSRSATCTFHDIKPGTYAIVAMHDENSNGKLDKNFFGKPTEGTGASRDARGTMGPPRWEDAVFSYGGGSAQVAVTIHYY